MTQALTMREQLEGFFGRTTADRAIVAVDLDNLQARGRRGYRRIDIVAFCAQARREMGRDCLIRVFANGMSRDQEVEWLAEGAEIVRTRTNADPVILEWLYAMRKARGVLIATGDRAFAAAAHFHRKLRHRVVVWSCRAKVATALLRAADRIEYCDDLLVQGSV